MGSADDDMVPSAPGAERRRLLPRSASSPKLRRQGRLPANMAVNRGVWLAIATMMLTVGVVLSLHVGVGGGVMRKRAETAAVDVWGHAERALNSTSVNATAWRDVVLASFSQWHGTRHGANAMLVNADEDVQARNDTVTVVEEVPLDPKRERMKHKNPRDTSWQQFTVVKPAGVEVRSVWDGSDVVKDFMSKPRSEDAPPANLQAAIGVDLEPWREGVAEEHIEQLYCGLGEASLRIQIINNLGYVVGESKSRYQQRHHRLKLQIQEFIQKFQGDWLPPGTEPPHGTRNVDFVLWTGDGHPPDERVDGKPDGQGPCDVKWGPMFSTSRPASRRKDFVVLVPDEAFLTGLPEANIKPWHELQPKVWAIKKDLPWAERRPEIQFHGSRSTPARLELFRNMALLESPLTDFAFTDAGDDGTAGFVKPEDGFLHPTEMCGTRYILYMEGRTGASSLRYALACGSVVLWPRDPVHAREEVFHPMLKDGIQLRILDPVTPENRGQHILEEVERLEAAAKDSNLTMRLANRAGAFADYELAGGHPYDGWRLQYWREVINQYAISQRFTLKEPHPQAVPLVDSIARGEHYTDLPDLADARKCSTCKAFGWGSPEEAARRQKAEDAKQKEFNKQRAKVGKAAAEILERRRVERKKAIEEKAEREKREAAEKKEKEKKEREERDAEQKRAEEDRQKAEKEKERAALEADEAALEAAKAKEEAEKADKGVADEKAERQADDKEKAAKAKAEVDKADAAKGDGRRLLAAASPAQPQRLLRRLAQHQTAD